MAENDELLLASIKAIAEKQGKTPEEVLAEMLKASSKKTEPSEPSTALSAPSERGVERYEFKRNSMTSPHLSRERIAMYENESAAEARERWYAEESMDDGGVLSPGGMTAGGIFGDGVVATEGYDPSSQMRYERRAGAAMQLKTLEVLNEMRRELAASRETTQRLLAERERARLPGRRGR